MTGADRPRQVGDRRWGGRAVCAAILGALLAPTPPAAAEWFVLCERGTGEIVVSEMVDEEAHVVLMGPLPGPRTASAWAGENCPSRRCDAAGRCLGTGTPTTVTDDSGGVLGTDGPTNNADDSGGWVAGELTTVTVGGSTAAQPAGGAAPVVAGPGGLAGPGATDLTPLVETAKAAAASCSYTAALAAADHMTNFDPEHPWLVANHDTLRRLAQRQRTCEQAVWQASSALEAGELKRAHQHAMSAADSAVSCQNQAVSALVTGIDTAIRQQRMARQAKRSRMAAALLPGLMDLARIASGGSPSPNATASAVTSMAQTAVATGSGVDACAFRLEYTDPASLVPSCTCPGYVFDPRSFRCVGR